MNRDTIGHMIPFQVVSYIWSQRTLPTSRYLENLYSYSSVNKRFHMRQRRWSGDQIAILSQNLRSL